MESSPPKYIFRFLQWFCPDHLYEEIEGDLIQKYTLDVRKLGEKKAKWKFILNTVRFFRPGILLRNILILPVIRNYMIRNYIKIAFRNFSKQKSFTLLNVTGLTLGMVASLLIMQYVKYE